MGAETKQSCNNKGAAVTHNLGWQCENWGFAPAHVLVNQERGLWNLPPLQRSRRLDGLAAAMATQAAKEAQIPNHHIATNSSILLDHDSLCLCLQGSHVAQVVSTGSSIRDIFRVTMTVDQVARRAILSKQHTEFGMGTARLEGTGKIILVQLFRG